jgi:hypothetical protein
MKTFLLGVLALSIVPLTAYASPTHPLAATKPVVEHNLEVQQRHARRVHEIDHAYSPARDKTFRRVDGRIKAQPHMMDAH